MGLWNEFHFSGSFFTKWHFEGLLACCAECTVFSKHQGCLQTPSRWDNYNVGSIKMTKRWSLKSSTGLLSIFSWGSKSHRSVQLLLRSISKQVKNKVKPKSPFVMLIPGGKMSNVVSSQHWLWYLPEVQQNRAILKTKVIGSIMYVCAKQMPNLYAGVFMIHISGFINKPLSQKSLSISLMESRNTAIYLSS